MHSIFIVILPILCVFTVYFTILFKFSSDSKLEPIQIILNKSYDKHNWWYLEYRDKTHNSEKSSRIPSSNDKCENLLLNGHWHKQSFNISGIIFEDKSGRKLAEDSPYHKHNSWHIYNHPFKSKLENIDADYSPREVKYSGEWRSDDNCKISKLGQIFDENSQCLTEDDTVMVIGDSRGRQLARAALSVLNGSVFNDMHAKGKSEHKLIYDTPRGRIKYFWSQKLAERGIYRLEQSFDRIKEEIEHEKYKTDIHKKIVDRVTGKIHSFNSRNRPKLLVLVSEHLLHPLHVCFGTKTVICDSPEDDCDRDCTLYNSSISAWIHEKLVKPFETETLPKLLKMFRDHENQPENLQKPMNFQIFFFAASYKVSPGDEIRNRMQVSMVDEYNKQLGRVIISAKTKHNLKNLYWIQVTEKIVLAPFDNLPLVLDGTHLSEQNVELAIGLQGTHRSILEVIFNLYCKDFGRVMEKGSCCSR